MFVVGRFGKRRFRVGRYYLGTTLWYIVTDKSVPFIRMASKLGYKYEKQE